MKGEAATPPANPADGEYWIVGAGAQSLWEGHDTQLAFHCASAWMFAAPRDGQRVFDSSSDCLRVWRDGWQALALPATPAGGTTVDAEARAALASLVDGLRAIGLGR